ncbi:hypothetical protein KP509_06G063300 [Ceratopteris richardii]|nr:hypothetical protein KP509_06G063300 [Ceratopteris richardii]
MSAQTAYPKPTAAHVHPNRDTQKTEKILRPVSVPRPRTLLTSYINMHPVGAPHSGSHSHNKGHGSTKGATLIPSNISRKPSNSLDFSGNTLEPSSPKITCLGRIKIKHKYCKETEKPVHVGAHRVWKHRDMSCIPDVSKLKDSSHGRNAHTEAAPTDNVASCCKTIRSESGKKNALKEGKSYLKFQKGKKNDSTSTTSATSAIKSSPAETATDLGRFHANQNIQEKNSKLWSTSTNDGYRSDLADFAPQVPPPNSLLLIRNRKTRGAYAALNDSLSNAITGVDLDGPFIHLHSTVQELEREAIHYDLSSSSLSKMGLGQFGAAAVEEMHPDKTEKAGLPEMEMKQMFTVITECKPSDRSKSTVCHHETSSATALPETRLWQRRFAMKPSDIKIAKPFASQIN